MVSAVAARGVSSAIVSNVGFVGVRSPSANDNMSMMATPQQVTNVKITSLHLVKQLVSIAATSKAQIEANTFLYNQSVKQQREDITEQQQYSEDSVAADAVPVIQESSSTISLAAVALTAGAGALAYSAYKLYDMFQQSLTGAVGVIGGIASLVGMSSQQAEAPIEQTDSTVSPYLPPPTNPSPSTPSAGSSQPSPAPKTPTKTPPPKTPPQRNNVGPMGGPATPPSRVSSPTPAASSSARSGPAVTITPPVRTQTPVPQTTAAPSPTAAPQAQQKPDASKQVSTGDIPKNDIVALGHYLIGKGADRHQLQHSAFGPVGEHSKKSRHYRDMAIDVNFPGPNEAAILDDLEPKLRAAGYNTIWRKPGHRTHMHVSVGGPEGGGAAGAAGSMLGSAMTAISETFEGVKQSITTVAKTTRDKMSLMPIQAEGVQSKAIEDNISRIQKDAEERERDMLSAARKAAVIHNAGQTPTQQEPPPPPPPSARGKSVTVVGDYFERFLGVSLQPNQIGLG